MKLRALLLAACLIAGAQTSVLHAQSDTLGYSARAPEWVAQFTTLSANAVLGGLTAGLFQELRGGSFKDGFTRGALGGAVVYAGKRIASEKFYGAGFAGREVAAVGASIVRNASDGIGSLDRLIVPAGFMRVYWHRPQKSLRVKLDVFAAGMIAYGVVEDELTFDAHESFSAGTAVFRTDNEVITSGNSDHLSAGITRGAVVLRAHVPGWGRDFLERALAHERVHVIQDDQLFITLYDHVDDWALSKLGPAATAARYIDVNPGSEVLMLLGHLISKHADRPWELEAIYLTR